MFQNALDIAIWRRFPIKFEEVPTPYLGGWCVLGEFDHVSAAKMNSWSDRVSHSPDNPSRGFTTAIPVFAAESDAASCQHFINLLTTNQNCTSVVAVLTLQLSPAFYHANSVSAALELETQFAGPDIAAVVKNQWLSLAPKLRSCTFRTLASPDVILLVELASDSDVAEFHAAAMKLSRLRLKELVAAIGVQRGKKIDIPDRGHAFSSVIPIVCFNSEMSVDQWANDLPDGELVFVSTIRPECGHADVVIQKLAGCNSVSKLQRAFGGQSTTVVTRGLKHFLEMRIALLSDPNWVQANISDIQTYISDLSLGEDLQTFLCEWCLDKKISLDLNQIKKGFDIGAPLMGETVSAAMNDVYDAFKQSFHTPNLITNCGDLLGFFRTTASITERLSRLDPPPNGFPINQAFANIIAFTRRAIRNRVEHRVVRNDPGLSISPQQSRVKLISGYSALVDTCWKVLRGISCIRGGTSIEDSKIPTFAACLSVGRDGYVRAIEPFARVRQHIERQFPDQSLPRAVCIDVSARLLQRPDFAPLQFFHEVAEATDFFSLPGLADVRLAVNQVATRLVCLGLATEITKHWSQDDGESANTREEAFNLAATFLRFGIWRLASRKTISDEDVHKNIPDYPEIRSVAIDYSQQTDPIEFLRSLGRWLQRGAFIVRRHNDALAKSAYHDGRLLTSDRAERALNSSAATRQPLTLVGDLLHVLPDILADYAVFIAAEVISPGTVDLNSYYEELVATATATYGNLSTGLHNVVRRWVLMSRLEDASLSKAFERIEPVLSKFIATDQARFILKSTTVHPVIRETSGISLVSELRTASQLLAEKAVPFDAVLMNPRDRDLLVSLIQDGGPSIDSVLNLWEGSVTNTPFNILTEPPN